MVENLIEVNVVKRKGLIPILFISFLQSYPQFQDFIVVHDYLVTPNSRMQARIRRRGQNGRPPML